MAKWGASIRPSDDLIADAIANGLGDKLRLAVELKRARKALAQLRDRCDCDMAIHQPNRRACVGVLARHGLGED